MKRRTQATSTRQKNRGVALVTTLLLLMVFMGMTLAMVISLSSDMLINGYYENFRGSFYAADSGLNIVRQQFANQIIAAVPSTFTLTSSPIPASTAASVQSSILSTYGGSPTLLNAGQAGSSWPGKFKISSATLTLANCLVIGGTGTCASPAGAITGYQYTYNYSLTAVGQTRATEQTTLGDNGSIIINVNAGSPAGSTVSFAAWGTFIDNYDICSALFVPGTITGPVFTNDSWTFGDTGPYIFTDPVGSAGSQAGYYFTSTNPQHCVQSGSQPPIKYKGKTINPTFQAGFNLGQPHIDLPPNDYNQKQAVLDGIGISASNPTNAQMNAVLKNISGTAYPTTGTSSGVYLPYGTTAAECGSATPPCMKGGGLYVEGNAAVTLAATTSSGHSLQVFNITQSGTTTTVTLDLTSSTTSIQSGSTTTVVNGLPENYGGGTPTEAAMLYVNGSISSLSTQSGATAAIQDSSAVSIVGASDVAITGDIKYKTAPVTTTQNQIVPGTSPACCNGLPADTLIPGHDNGQVLGIFTATGDIQLKVPSNNQNLEVDASLAMISATGSGGLIDTWNQINTLTIVGGRIANQAKQGNITTRNIYFDRRFSQGGFSPPWFPATTLTSGGTVSSVVNPPSIQRVQWVNQTAY
jgi:Tfp pilus assembly protein PilX